MGSASGKSFGFTTARQRGSLKCSLGGIRWHVQRGPKRYLPRRRGEGAPIEDEDAWTLALYICSVHMQRETSGLYKSLAFRFINSILAMYTPFQGLMQLSSAPLRNALAHLGQ
jgi:hypothetical protein